MEPITLVIIFFILPAIFLGKSAEGLVHAAKGTTPPSVLRERNRLKAEQKRLDTLRDIAKETGEPVEYTRPFTWSDVLATASSLAAMKANQKLLDRQDKLTEERREKARERAQAAEDRLAKRQGLGGRNSAAGGEQAATSAPDPIEAPPAGAERGGEPATDAPATGGPATAEPAADEAEATVVPDANAGPGMTGGALAGNGKCNWSEVGVPQACGATPDDNELSLCADHIDNVPAQATLTRHFATIAGRCQWGYKEFTYAQLRCTGKVEQGGEVDGKPWSFCGAHRRASLQQLRAKMTPEPAGEGGDKQPPNDTPPRPSTSPRTALCNVREVSAYGGTMTCTAEAEAGSPFDLCPHHNSLYPHSTNLHHGTDSNRCTWIHKATGAGQELRCTGRPDRSSDPNNDRCRNHPRATEPKKPEPSEKPTGSCNWKAWIGAGAVSVCGAESDPSSPGGLCRPHEEQAPQVSSLVRGGIEPGRCDWEFKHLPFGALRCINTTADPANPAATSHKCEVHGGVAPAGATKAAGDMKYVAGTSNDQQKEEANGPNEPVCTHDMNCTACKVVDGKPICLRDLPNESADTSPPPAQPDPAPQTPQDDQSSNAAGENMTSAETTSAAGLEATTLGGAKGYLTAMQAACDKAMADIDSKMGAMRGNGGMSDGPTFAALNQAKDALVSCGQQLGTAMGALDSSMGALKEGFEANPEAGTKEFITGE